MPNHVTNRLEINADRETVQSVMNFLKGENDADNTPKLLLLLVYLKFLKLTIFATVDISLIAVSLKK